MDILPYDPVLSAALAQSYNRAICGVPHCYPVAAETLAPVLAGEDAHWLQEQTALVALEGEQVLGCIHAAVRPPKDEGDVERGVLRFFWYERGRRTVGQALLEAAEDHLRQHGLHRVEAFRYDYRYPFYYLDHAYLSARLNHVHALLGWNGYQHLITEVFYDWPNFEPEEIESAPVGIDVTLQWQPGGGTRPGLVARAVHNSQEMGVCETVSAGEFSDHAEAQDWCFTEWLGIAEELRGSGLGRHLLQRALHALRGIGYRHAAISTNGQNFRAQLFYSNCGYQVVDWTHALQKELEP